MTIKHTLTDDKGNSITISVDFNIHTQTVSKVNYVMAQKGMMSVDITEIFLEQMDGDATIDKIKWAEIAETQELDPIDYDNIESYELGYYEDSINSDR